LPGDTVLIIDDNSSDVFFIRKAFRSHGGTPEFFVASDGAEAILMVGRIEVNDVPCPELIVLDLSMPRKNGFEVLSRIRQSAHCGKTPVVMLSSSTSPKDREHAMRLGANLYFTKPASLTEFLELGKHLVAFLSMNKRNRETAD
jgi:CheY-like chemotaxis protein